LIKLYWKQALLQAASHGIIFETQSHFNQSQLSQSSSPAMHEIRTHKSPAHFCDCVIMSTTGSHAVDEPGNKSCRYFLNAIIDKMNGEGN